MFILTCKRYPRMLDFIFTWPIHLPLSLSLSASWNYHAKFYRVNMIYVLVFSVMEMKVEDKSKFFDALISLMQWGVDMSASVWWNCQSTESNVVELPVYWIISLWSMLEQSFFIYILYDSGMLNIPIKCGVFKVLYYFQ